MAAAEAEAVKNNWAMAIIILDSTGHMVMLHKLDNTQYGSLMAAEDKALSAINYRRPSRTGHADFPHPALGRDFTPRRYVRSSSPKGAGSRNGHNV
jgi:uncharacterized protein GlcG (DUF336 family)